MKRTARISSRVAVVLCVLGAGAAAPAWAAPGDLDPTFGQFGKVVLEAPDDTAATDLLLQPDGKPVAFGWTGYNNTSSSVFRFLPEGELDPSFGQAGVSSLDFGLWYQTVDAGLLLGDGKIVYATSVSRDSYHGPLVVLTRLLADGSPDPAYGGGDGVTVSDLPVNGGALDLALAPDGRIVLATGAEGGGFLAARFLPDGEPDPSFSEDGAATASVPDAGVARTVLVTPDGGVIAAGDGGRDGGPRSSLVSFQSDGDLDPAFGADGVVTTDFGSGRRSEVGELALQPDGRLVLTGILGLRKIRPIVARYRPAGEPDPTFSGDGVEKLGKFSCGAALGAVTIRPDGRIVAGGSAESDFFVARLLQGGKPDRSFSKGRGLRTGIGGNGKRVASLALAPTGRSWPPDIAESSSDRLLRAGDRRYCRRPGHDADADGHRDGVIAAPNLSAVALADVPFFEREISLDYTPKAEVHPTIEGKQEGARGRAGGDGAGRPGRRPPAGLHAGARHGDRSVPPADPSGRFSRASGGGRSGRASAARRAPASSACRS